MSTSESTHQEAPVATDATHDCRCQPLKNPVRAERRKHNATVAAAAIEIDKNLNASIDSAAEKLDVPREELATHFALKSVFGEKRPPTVFNGLVAEKSKEWSKDYVGPGRGFLPYIAKRIKDEKLVAKAEKSGQSEKYIKLAMEVRTNKKSNEGASHSRAAAIKNAQGALSKINKELLFIHKQTGIEYILCLSRGKVNDQMDPHYYASDKAINFLEGNINVQVDDFLRLFDLSSVGGVGGLQMPIQTKKDVYRKSVRSLLNSSYCQALHAMGHDVSNFRHIEYANYPDLVERFRVVVRGYPLNTKGHLVQPSNFPNGLKGLINAKRHLDSGDWGFEKIQDATYDAWMNDRHLAAEAGSPPPSPPFISVPGTSLEEVLLAGASNSSEVGGSSKKKRAANKPAANKDAKKSKTTSKPHGKQGVKAGRKKGPKSAETIASDLDDESDDGEWEKYAEKKLNGESDEEDEEDEEDREDEEVEEVEDEDEDEDEDEEGNEEGKGKGKGEGEEGEDEDVENGGVGPAADQGMDIA